MMRTQTVLEKALFAKQGEEFSAVSMPHTWNNLDGQDGGSDYWRGHATYKFELQANVSTFSSRVLTMWQP